MTRKGMGGTASRYRHRADPLLCLDHPRHASLPRIDDHVRLHGTRLVGRVPLRGRVAAIDHVHCAEGRAHHRVLRATPIVATTVARTVLPRQPHDQVHHREPARLEEVDTAHLADKV